MTMSGPPVGDDAVAEMSAPESVTFAERAFPLTVRLVGTRVAKTASA